MDHYSDSIKSEDRQKIERFFGYIKSSSANMFKYHSVQFDGDKIIILTNNITEVKEKPVFMVAPNKGIYLQDWQYTKVESKRYGLKCYAVQLRRKFFNPFTFSFQNEKFAYIPDGDQYDSWLQLAYEQEEAHYTIKIGWKDEK